MTSSDIFGLSSQKYVSRSEIIHLRFTKLVFVLVREVMSDRRGGPLDSLTGSTIPSLICSQMILSYSNIKSGIKPNHFQSEFIVFDTGHDDPEYLDGEPFRAVPPHSMNHQSESKVKRTCPCHK